MSYWTTVYLATFSLAIAITNILIFFGASIWLWVFVALVMLGFWCWWFNNFGVNVQYFQLAVPPIFLLGCLIVVFLLQ